MIRKSKERKKRRFGRRNRFLKTRGIKVKDFYTVIRLGKNKQTVSEYRMGPQKATIVDSSHAEQLCAVCNKEIIPGKKHIIHIMDISSKFQSFHKGDRIHLQCTAMFRERKSKQLYGVIRLGKNE